MAERPFAALNLPYADLKISTGADGQLYIYDCLRQKWVRLTPEEWVRQNFVAFMVDHRGYPRLMMANEVGIRLNNTLRRCDTVVTDRIGAPPLMIVEYKAPTVEITQRVFDQIARYNMVLSARWLVVSNGLRHFCCRLDAARGSYSFVSDIPRFEEAQKR